MNKRRPALGFIILALALTFITTGAADSNRSIPREGADLFGDLVAMNLDRPRRTERSPLDREWTWHNTKHFLLLTDAPEEWSIHAGRSLEKTRECFYDAFRSAGLRPGPLGQRMVWVAFRDREEFNRYALGVDRQDMSWADGYYSTKTNRVALVCNHRDEPQAATELAMTEGSSNVLPVPRSGFRNLAQTTHEAAHQLAFNSGLQKRGVMYPLWATEGLATNFEAESSEEPIGPHLPNAHRLRQLLDAVERDALIPLDEFIATTRPPVSDARATHDAYAQSWAFFRFLFTHRSDPLDRYLHHLTTLEPGKRDARTLRLEFTKAFGPTRKLEKSWKAYLRVLAEDEKRDR